MNTKAYLRKSGEKKSDIKTEPKENEPVPNNVISLFRLNTGKNSLQKKALLLMKVHKIHPMKTQLFS